MTPYRDRLSVALIGPSRFGIDEPFAGGLEAHTATLARALEKLGHQVIVFAGDPSSARPTDLEVRPVLRRKPREPGSGRIDTSMTADRRDVEHQGYTDVLEEIRGDERFDVVHNNSLHYLPPTAAKRLPIPMVHTLHCPPFPELQEGHLRGNSGRAGKMVVAVSDHLRRSWGTVADRTIPNGIDVERWPFGGGGEVAVWSGRFVPEKAPHMAIEAAKKADVLIVLAGPIQHRVYYDERIAPLLGRRATWIGHQSQHGLAALYRAASVGLVTPDWDEPFGLVAPEMMACGTPIAGFARGGLADVLTTANSVVAKDGDAADLAGAIEVAAKLDRRGCRESVLESHTDLLMAQRYERTYRELLR